MLAFFPPPQSPPKVKNEMVMRPGMTLAATTKSGRILIRATDEFSRSYTWEGATRSVELQPRPERWYGSLGAYYPGPGDHWKLHNGITRGVLEEGQQHFKTVAQARKWIKDQAWVPNVYRNDGLFVGWGKTLERRQLNVEVFQIYVNGRKPTRLPGANDRAIVVRQERLPSPKASLAEAVRRSDRASVETLLRKGANPNGLDANGTPLLVTASGKGEPSIVAALLGAGADPNVRDKSAEGTTPLLCAYNPEVVRLLLAKGADPNLGQSRGMMRGATRLMAACMLGEIEVAKLLLDAGAKPDLASADGKTPLHAAASAGKLTLVSLLLDRGAAVDPRDQLGMTPLIQTVMLVPPSAGQLELIKLLIAKGANVNARLDNQRLAYARAAFVGDQAAMKRLRESGKLDRWNDDGPSVLQLARDEATRAALRAAGAKG